VASRRFVTVRSEPVPLPPEAVMDRIRRPATWPSWQPEIEAADGPEVLEAGDEVSGPARLLGFHVDGRAHVLSVDESALEQDVLVGVRMRLRYEVRAGPSGSVVTHRLAVRLPSGLSGRLLSLFLKPRLRRLQAQALGRLAGPT
jgi:hypothetical protein